VNGNWVERLAVILGVTAVWWLLWAEALASLVLAIGIGVAFASDVVRLVKGQLTDE
jgi:hypothetical protein